MAEARTRDEWGRTSSLMALLANCNRDPKKTRAYRPSDFDPFSKTGRSVKGDFNLLREVFVK
ncbi:MAG TPA: hypothetical protein PKN33_20640 [Phycisphaerae bacterium]|nr:hypothetical protein [Phycisphaerae bacterium]